MNESIQGVDIQDELNIYLVANGLKPATLITLDALHFDRDYNIKKDKGFIFIYEEADIKLKQEDVKQFREFLDRLNVTYYQKKNENWQSYNVNGRPINVERILFYVGRDSCSLERLLNAKNDDEMGLALGYPLEDVKAYGKEIDGEKRDGQYVQVCLAKAKRNGLKLPTWLAYISHVPKDLDLINGKVSETSKALGEKYQAFVRDNNPKLAKRVEQNFLNGELPDYWRKTPDGSYDLYFE